ncbi:MAG: DUF6922 domain-containing protein [Polaribacter sp.]
MFFEDWEKYANNEVSISKTLLWEYDLTNFDWEAMKIKVVQRVVERGWETDYFAIFKKYGGIENVREIIKQIAFLKEKHINFVCVLFNLKKKN